MAMRTATNELHKRITAAAAVIGRGVRYARPEMEFEGRRLSAKAHIENQILLGRAYLTKEDIQHVIRLVLSTNPDDLLHTADPETNSADLDQTSDSEETTDEILALKLAPTSKPIKPLTNAHSIDDDDEDLEGDEI